MKKAHSDLRQELRKTQWESSRIREIDRHAIQEYGMSSLVLMENAGRGAADWIDRFLVDAGSTAFLPKSIDGPIVLLCGPGNNGGDGLVIARHLEFAGWQVEIWMVADPNRLSLDCQANLSILEKAQQNIHWWNPARPSSDEDDCLDSLKHAPVIIDALLGTGAKGEPRAPMDRLLAFANQQHAWRVAIDIPTGLDADTGNASSNCFRAHHTLTFAAMKKSLPTPFAGTIVLLPIGVPRALFQNERFHGDTSSRK